MRLGCLLAAVWLGGCTAPENGSRWSRHFDADIWGGAVAQQVQRPDRLIPEAALLTAVPFAFIYDTDVHNHYENYTVDSNTQNTADALQLILPAIPLTIGTVDWARGDGGRNMEVVAESLGGVVVLQQALAHTVGRERPNGKDNLSFPSGHTSWAFAATTLIVRDLHDPSDTSFHAVDALVYVPAMFAAWERVAANEHWTSDVVCGALLGVFLTNTIWDAHFGSHEETRPTIYRDVRPRGIAWRPSLDWIDDRPAVGIEIGF